MTRFVVNVVAIVIAVYVAKQVLPAGDVSFGGLRNLVIFAVVLGLLNAFVRPVIRLLTCPLALMTLGLFSLIVNAAMFWLAAVLTSQVQVRGFFVAFIAALIVSAVNLVIGILFE